MWLNSITFFAYFYVVSGAYFTMTDIEVNIPGNRSKLLPRNRSIVTLNALHNDDNLNTTIGYSIINTGERYLQAFHTTGDIMFTDRFLEDPTKNVTDIAVEVHAQEDNGEDNTTFKINITPPDLLDCDLLTQDLCYWQSASYRIYENRKANRIGSISSPYLAEMCEGFKINYTLLKGSSHFALLPPTISNKSWGIQTTKPLDRDVSRAAEPFYQRSSVSGKSINITVECSVEDPQGTKRDIQKEIVINVLDEDDNSPVSKEKDVLRVILNDNMVSKDQIVQHKDLIFIDRDSPEVNYYTTKILNDKLNILKEICQTIPDDRDAEVQTVLHCKLKFTKSMKLPNSPYKVILQINDTTLRPGFGKSVVELPINIHTANDRHKGQLVKQTTPAQDLHRPLKLYPSREVTIFRTAAPFARVTQPNNLNKNYITNFVILNGTNANGSFEVTKTEGIVYVHNVAALRESRTHVRLGIQWEKNGKKEVDEVTINIASEPTHTCQNKTSFIEDWSWCSEYSSPAKCENSCGISTGGSPNVLKRKSGKMKRCMWRGEKKPGPGITSLYSTCTPDTDTCPNGICDSLEELYDLICPQDCTKDVMIPTSLNARTGRGIDMASGVCTCTNKAQCSCNPVKFNFNNKKKVSTTAAPTQPPQNLTNNLPTHLSRHTGTEKATCGTTCMLGIAAGIVFLLGAVAVVVACWRLDRVQKAVRGKFSDDAPDLSAPLSEYVDRGILPDTLHLNFGLTSAMNNQINKTAPDPKWEFPRNQLIIEQTLGEGEFGKVLRARAKEIGGQPGYTTVAVKTLKDDAYQTELADLLSEYELLKEVSHPNIIRLLGASTTPGGPVYLIIEFAQFGSLRSYLRRSRHLKSESRPPSTGRLEEPDPRENYDHPNVCKVTPKDILSFAWQISNGMSYLSDIKLVHRDLAARNVLLATGKICKISDFGLTRDVYEDNAYFKRSKGRVPVKWMAPESLSDHLYTSKSDVWSFGILIWELVTLGATPYPGILVHNLFHLLRQGYRMERPENCSTALYIIMRACWHIDPEHRPTFSRLAVKFEKMLSDGVEYLDLNTNVIHNRSYFCMNYEDNEDENENTDIKSSQSLVNYLDKTQQYVKCGESDKFLEPLSENAVSDEEAQEAQPSNDTTQGYETPVKVREKSPRSRTPTNECPQYYTEMGACNSTTENLVA